MSDAVPDIFFADSQQADRFAELRPSVDSFECRFHLPNVEVNRSKDGAAPAPQEPRLKQESVPMTGSAIRPSAPLGYEVSK